MDPAEHAAPRLLSPLRVKPIRLLEVGLSVPVVGGLVFVAIRYASLFNERKFELVFWTVIVAFLDIFPVPAWRDVRMDMSFPLLMAVAILYPPQIAFFVAFVGSLDPRELKRELEVWRALFNRSQIALAVLTGSFVFHALASLQDGWVRLIPAAILAAVSDYIVNSATVALGGSLLYRLPFPTVLRKLRIGNLAEFLLSYVGLGVLGALLARLYIEVDRGEWAVALFLMPLLLARQMFFRSRALEEATAELREREKVLRQLSDRMAEERYDERRQVANYLHDDLAQILFRLGLQVDVAKKYIESGAKDKGMEALAHVRDAKDRSVDVVRGLIKDLHTSPLGRAGLSAALENLTSDLREGRSTKFHVNVEDLSLPPPIQLLAYQIAREAMTNAVLHANPENVWVDLEATPDVELQVRDDGSGFDPEGASPEGHFGMVIMRERAQLVRGTLEVESAPLSGTLIRVRFPATWLEPEEAPGDPERDGLSPGPA